MRFSPLIQLLFISVIAHIALTGSRVATSLYALSLHASPLTVGTLVAVFALFPMLLAVQMGRLIDRIGIKKPMIGGCLSLCLGCLLPSLVASLGVLYLAAILMGTGFMAIHISSQHAVGALSLKQSQSNNFTWLSISYSISSFCGPVIAGFSIDHAPHAFAYVLFLVFSVSALGLIVFGNLGRITLPKHVHTDADAQAHSAFALLNNPELRRNYLVGTLLAAAWDLFTFVIPIRGSYLGLSASTIGLILGSFSAGTFVVRLVMPSLSSRYSAWKILVGALLIAVFCYLLFPFMQHAFTLALLAGVLGLALGSCQPNVLTLLHHASPPGRAAEVVAIRATIGNASQVLLPLVFGAAGAALGLFAVFWSMAAMIAFGIPLAWHKAFEKNGEK